RFTGDQNKGFSFQVAAMMYAFLLTVRGIPQIYYGSETGLEGYKNFGGGNNDYDLRRDFPWQLIGANNDVSANFVDESMLFQTIKKLISFRRNSDALKYGVVITLWVDNFVYAFLRYFRDDVVIVVFNNGYQPMPSPLQIPIGTSAKKDLQPLPDRIIALLTNNKLLNIFDNTERVGLQNGLFAVTVNGKSFKIFSS
ncbi:MAG TPA: hypothetical protein VNW49_04945, partial [Puia sp.]|nr:hypothetical protein [Puia sp.]